MKKKGINPVLFDTGVNFGALGIELLILAGAGVLCSTIADGAKTMKKSNRERYKGIEVNNDPVDEFDDEVEL